METILQYIPAVLSAILLAVLILMVITNIIVEVVKKLTWDCLLYTSPSPRDRG